MINIWKKEKLSPSEQLAKYEVLVNELSEAIVEVMQTNPYPDLISKHWAIIWNELEKAKEKLLEADEGEDNLENIKVRRND